MKARSAISPPLMENLGNRFRLNFIVQTKTDDQNDIVFEYQSIEVTEIRKSVIVSGLIRLQYSVNDEIALINNFNLDNATYRQEYEAYQNYRNECKTISTQFTNE